MRLAIWSVTRGAGNEAIKIREKIGDCDIYTLKKFSLLDTIQMDNFTESLEREFHNYDGHIFIMATGIVVRKIKDMLKGKDIDPAILVLDEGGNFVISLVSGHLGGANQLSERLGKKLGRLPVITTSSDVTGKIAVDSIAQKINSELESLEKAKNITSLIVDGKEVMLKLPSNIVENNGEGIIFVSNKEKVEMIQLYPKNLIVGIGARKGIQFEDLNIFLKEVFSSENLSLKSIKKFSTVDIKEREKGIIELANHYNKRLEIIKREDILEVENMFEGSEFVKKNIGVSAVSAPVAFLASCKKGRFIVQKRKKDGMTISIYEEELIYEK